MSIGSHYFHFVSVLSLTVPILYHTFRKIAIHKVNKKVDFLNILEKIFYLRIEKKFFFLSKKRHDITILDSILSKLILSKKTKKKRGNYFPFSKNSAMNLA
jgi:hypothetical protein